MPRAADISAGEMNIGSEVGFHTIIRKAPKLEYAPCKGAPIALPEENHMAGLRYANMADRAIRAMAREFPALTDPEKRLALAEAVSASYSMQASESENIRSITDAVRKTMLSERGDEPSNEGQGEIYVVNVLRMRRGVVLSSRPYFVSVPDAGVLPEVEANILARDVEVEVLVPGCDLSCLSLNALFDGLESGDEIVFFARGEGAAVERGRVTAGSLRERAVIA